MPSRSISEAEPINGPRHDDVEPALAGILEQRIEAGPLLSSLGPADCGIAVDIGHLPAAALGELPELADLALNRLVVDADPDVEHGTLGFHQLDSLPVGPRDT
ncbi:MAG: hypothetical protein WAO08_24595 [Hyphomicrobiaceae bacterium]